MRPATDSSSSPIFKVLAGVFVLFLILIINIANRGEGDRWWSFIHNIPFGDKLGHIGLMGTLSLLCNLAFSPRPVPFLPASITRVTFVLFLLITLEELSQAFLPTRSCDPIDLLADLTGLALGQLTALALIKTDRRSHFSLGTLNKP